MLQTLLDHAFGAAPTSTSAVPIGDDPGETALHNTDTAGGDVHTDSDTADTADAADDLGRLELAELVGVLRDPIEWVFTLAERRAHGDSVDIAAIHRVRDAVLHRVNAIIVKAPSAASPRIRSGDLWTVGGLLIDALDPSLVERVLRGTSSRITELLAAGLPFEPSLAAYLGCVAAPLAHPCIPSPIAPPCHAGAGSAHPVAPPCHACAVSSPCRAGAVSAHPVAPPCHACAVSAHSVAPPWCAAAMPHVPGLCGGLAATHVLRPVVLPPWSWPQTPVGF